MKKKSKYNNFDLIFISLSLLLPLTTHIPAYLLIKQAFKTNEHNGNNKRLPGAMSKYTPDQLFFISFAHVSILFYNLSKQKKPNK